MFPGEHPVPPPPPQATRLLGADGVAALTGLAALLAGPAIERGLLGPRERDRLWDRHLLNCAVAVHGVPAGAAVLDVGSGAGLPGLVWALLRPDLMVSLVEPALRRSEFLQAATRTLLRPDVQVHRERAEDLHGQLRADVVTARAVAPLDRLARWCLPLVQPGGELRALKGRDAAEEVDKALPGLLRAGAREVRVGTYGEGVLAVPTTVVHISVPTPSALRRKEETP